MSLSATPLRLQERAQDLVGRARIDVVGAEQHEALGAAAFLAHQVLDGGNRLLVRRGAGVEHVLRQLFAFVLHRVEQQAVQFLEHRQHRLARHRGPAAEHDRDLVLRDQLARLLGEQRPVRRRVDDHGLELLAQHAALGVDLVDRHQRDVLQHRLADRHRAGQRVQHADLDRVGGVRRRAQRESGSRERCRERQSFQKTSSLHGLVPVSNDDVAVACLWQAHRPPTGRSERPIAGRAAAPALAMLLRTIHAMRGERALTRCVCADDARDSRERSRCRERSRRIGGPIRCAAIGSALLWISCDGADAGAACGATLTRRSAGALASRTQHAALDDKADDRIEPLRRS